MTAGELEVAPAASPTPAPSPSPVPRPRPRRRPPRRPARRRPDRRARRRRAHRPAPSASPASTSSPDPGPTPCAEPESVGNPRPALHRDRSGRLAIGSTVYRRRGRHGRSRAARRCARSSALGDASARDLRPPAGRARRPAPRIAPARDRERSPTPTASWRSGPSSAGSCPPGRSRSRADEPSGHGLGPRRGRRGQPRDPHRRARAARRPRPPGAVSRRPWSTTPVVGPGSSRGRRAASRGATSSPDIATGSPGSSGSAPRRRAPSTDTGCGCGTAADVAHLAGPVAEPDADAEHRIRPRGPPASRSPVPWPGKAGRSRSWVSRRHRRACSTRPPGGS